MSKRKVCEVQRGPSKDQQDDVMSETDQTLGLGGGTAGANRGGGIGGANREGGDSGANRAGGTGGANLAGGRGGANPEDGDYGEHRPNPERLVVTCTEEPDAPESEGEHLPPDS